MTWTKTNNAARWMRALCLVVFSATNGPVLATDDPWPDIHTGVFQGRQIEENSPLIQIFVPNQADDAAIVPVSVRVNSSIVAQARSLTLVIDRNPMPVAASFAFGEGFRTGPNVGERTLSTRVRVDAFSRVRAILETMDGALHMDSKFVIGAGGCSAPAAKDRDAAASQLGRTQLKMMKDDSRGTAWREAQIMIKHPNSTGMQIDKETGDYTPAKYVNSIEVSSGNQVLFKMEGGISISENPNIRFTYATDSDDDLNFEAMDTSGTKFAATNKGGRQ
ncbi:MAG: quinoprotein dehydrogenase-associated SoxYZ-like carrier [Hyphomicrobium sp.]